MKWIVILLIAIGGIYAARFRRRQENSCSEDKAAVDDKREKENCDATGCGVNCFCDDQALQRAVKTELEYFDDEELDAYKGLAADAYTEEQINLFQEVLTTLQEGEVGDWLRSLDLRGINLPDALKDEAFMRMEEER